MFGIDNIVNAVEDKIGAAVVSGLSPGNAKDSLRAANARAALAKAVAGSLTDAQLLLQGRFHSATAYGKAQYQIAWDSLVQQNPALAAEALKQAPTFDPVNTTPSIREKLAAEWNSLVAKIREDVGTTVQRIGSGATTAAAQAVDPNTQRVTVPIIGGSTLWMLAIVVLAIAAVVLILKKKHA